MASSQVVKTSVSNKTVLLRTSITQMIFFNQGIIIVIIVIAFSRSSRTHPNFVSQVQEIKIFCEDCKLAAPVGFFRGFGPHFRVHRFKSARPAKNA